MKPKYRSIVLLLTATIDPGETPFVARRDPATRLKDYLFAVDKWLSSGAAPRLVFCENSGYDLTPLKRLAGPRSADKIEFISFSGNQSGATRGKGHAELRLIDHAIRNSVLIGNTDIVMKCTGRLTLQNAAAVLEATATTDFDIMCSLKSYLSFADSRLFAATPAFIAAHLLPRLETIDDASNVHLEHALACATADAVSRRLRWRPFPIFPRISGTSGTTGLSMTNSALSSAAKILYHRARTFVYEH